VTSLAGKKRLESRSIERDKRFARWLRTLNTSRLPGLAASLATRNQDENPAKGGPRSGQHPDACPQARAPFRTGLVPWPKLIQKLRATGETELLARYPTTDVTRWLGNYPQVVKKHYSMTMQESFDQAIERGAAIPGAPSKVPLNIPQSLQDKAGQPKTEKNCRFGKSRY